MEGPGPRVRQISNAYRILLPAKAAQLLGHLLSRPGLPDDLVQEQADRAEWVAAQKRALPLEELPLAEVQDDRLARLLGELGRAVEARAKGTVNSQAPCPASAEAGRATGGEGRRDRPRF